MVTRTWTYAARRRIFLYTPATALGAVLFLVAGYPANGATILGAALMLSAALAAALDNDPTPVKTGTADLGGQHDH